MKEAKQEQLWRIKILDIYLFSWILCGIIYPLWLIPHSHVQRAIIYAGALIVFYSAYYFLEKTQLFSNAYIELSLNQICPRWFFKDKYMLILFCITCGALLTILPLLTLPITPRGDEEAHVSFAISLLNNFSIPTELIFSQDAQFMIRVMILVSAFTIISIFILNKRRKEASEEEKEKRPQWRKYKSMAFIALFGAYFFFMNLIPSIDRYGLFRYPPVSKIVTIFVYALFGISEETARIPAVFFYVISILFMYKLTLEITESKKTGILATVFFMFFPGYFYYAGIAYLTTGLLALLLVVFYYFVKYQKKSQKKDIILCFFFLSILVLYRHEGILFAFIITFLLLIEHVSKAWKNEEKQTVSVRIKVAIRDFLPLYGAYAVAFGVVYAIYVKFPVRIYQYAPEYFFSIEKLIDYGVNLHFLVSYVWVFLFLLGSVYFLIWKRDKQFLLLSIWFITLYMFYTGFYVHTLRLIIPLLPVVAIISAAGIVAIIEKFPKKEIIFWCFFIGFLLYSYLIATFVPLAGINPDYAVYESMERRYVPYDQAGAYINEEIKEGTKFLIPFGPNPIHYYIAPADMEKNLSFDNTIWMPVEEQTTEALYNYTTEQDIDYLLFPYTELTGDMKITNITEGYAYWTADSMNRVVLQELRENQSPYFQVEKIFTFGVNEVLLIKVVQPVDKEGMKS